MEIVKFNGRIVEVIELFSDHLIVQDIRTKEIFLILYCQVEKENEICYNSDDVSNIISLEFWKQCLRKTKSKKTTFQKKRRLV